MVLATKRAAGSEYDYPIYSNSLERHSPARQQKVRTRRTKKSSPVVGVVAISLLFALGLSYVFLQATKARLNWQIKKAEENVAIMHMENEKIRLGIAALSSLDRIESIATNQLQMVKPPKVEYLAFQDGMVDSKGAEYIIADVKSEEDSAKKNIADNDTLLQKIAAAINEGIRG